MICTNENRLAELIASRIGTTCIECKQWDKNNQWCLFFNSYTTGIKMSKDRLQECKELFEVGNETK